MDQVIWVEILSRHRDVAVRHRCAGPELRIGRGYGNDVVIDDPYVAAEHLRIVTMEDGALIAENVGGANGLYVDHNKHPVERIILHGDRPIRIGQTWLRVRTPDFVVARERIDERRRVLWPLALGLALAVLGLEALSVWLGETTEPKLSAYLTPLLAVALIVPAWAAGWAILSRVFSGQARYERHLIVALAGLGVLLLYVQLASYGAYALSWRLLTLYPYVGLWLGAGLMCFLHLRVLGHSRLVLKGGITLALLGGAIAMQTVLQSEARSSAGQQSSLRQLFPPALRLTPVRSEADFFAAVEELKAKLNRDRIESRPSGDSSASDEED